jgi:hypothetical protein
MRILYFFSTGLVVATPSPVPPISSAPVIAAVPEPVIESLPAKTLNRKTSSLQSVFDWLGKPFKSSSSNRDSDSDRSSITSENRHSTDVTLVVPADQRTGSVSLQLPEGASSVTVVFADRPEGVAEAASRRPSHPKPNRRRPSNPPDTIINMIRAPGYDIPRVVVRLAGWPHSVYSFVFDTGSALDLVTISGYPRQGVTTPVSGGTRRDIQLQGGVVSETISLPVSNGENPFFSFLSTMALGMPVHGSVIGHGVLAANRNSRFVQEVGNFVIVPRSRGRNVAVDPQFAGLLVFGSMDLKNFCRDGGDDIVTVRTIANVNGDWAIPGGVAVGRNLVPQIVTLVIDTSSTDVVLPRNTYYEYVQELRNAGLVVELSNENLVIRNCDYQLRQARARLPSITISVGNAVTSSSSTSGESQVNMEIGSNEFTTKDQYSGMCILRVRTGESCGFNDQVAVLSSPFLKSVALRLHNIANSVSICPAV